MCDNHEFFGLDDYPPAARNQDPMTSHEAAEDITSSGERHIQCRIVLRAVEKTPRLTARELAAEHGIRHEMVHKRLPDLRSRGLVHSGAPRPCRVTGRRALVWETTDAEEGGNHVGNQS